jgi:hypothetical protein
MAKKLNLGDMLEEISFYAPDIKPQHIEKGKKAKLAAPKQKELNQLAKDWVGGTYDNDPEILGSNLLNLLPNE